MKKRTGNDPFCYTRNMVISRDSYLRLNSILYKVSELISGLKMWMKFSDLTRPEEQTWGTGLKNGKMTGCWLASRKLCLYIPYKREKNTTRGLSLSLFMAKTLRSTKGYLSTLDKALGRKFVLYCKKKLMDENRRIKIIVSIESLTFVMNNYQE